MRFASSFDTKTLSLTLVASLMLLFALAAVSYVLFTMLSSVVAPLLFVFALSLVALGTYIFAISPSGAVLIQVDRRVITVFKRVGAITVPLDDIAHIRLLASAEAKSFFRIFGSGGFFGWFGRFRSSQIGPFQLLATRLDNLLLVESKLGAKFVFSVDDSVTFLKSVKAEVDAV